jgi:ribosomal protein S18 acetylase RimI-like enzyme
MVMELEIRELTREELPAAGGVADRALADNPSSRWAWGEEPVHRLGCSLDFLGGMVLGMPLPQIGAVVGRHVVGVCAASPPGTCLASQAPAELRTLPEAVGPPGDESRAVFEWAVIAVHDLDERHWHVGPVGVEPGLHGRGVGGRLLTALGTRLDDEGEIAWLETDKPENVALYHRHGFEVTAHVELHGLSTWFMRRDPR